MVGCLVGWFLGSFVRSFFLSLSLDVKCGILATFCLCSKKKKSLACLYGRKKKAIDQSFAAFLTVDLANTGLVSNFLVNLYHFKDQIVTFVAHFEDNYEQIEKDKLPFVNAISLSLSSKVR